MCRCPNRVFGFVATTTIQIPAFHTRPAGSFFATQQFLCSIHTLYPIIQIKNSAGAERNNARPPGLKSCAVAQCPERNGAGWGAVRHSYAYGIDKLIFRMYVDMKSPFSSVSSNQRHWNLSLTSFSISLRLSSRFKYRCILLQLCKHRRKTRKRRRKGYTRTWVRHSPLRKFLMLRMCGRSRVNVKSVSSHKLR